MTDINELRQAEPIRLDQEKLYALYSELGQVNADDVVCRAVEELAVRMAHCLTYHEKQQWSDLRKTARSMVAIDDQLGMIALARVAQNVTQAVDSAQDPAISATLARLGRVGERSLMAIWDVQDMSV